MASPLRQSPGAGTKARCAIAALGSYPSTPLAERPRHRIAVGSDWCYDPAAISGEAFDTYVRAYQAPGAVRGAMADYRANAEDVAQDIADAEAKIACPVMSLWGADFYAVGKMFDMPKVWGEIASNLVTHAIPQCGHLPQEEQPEVVTRLLVDFLENWNG